MSLELTFLGGAGTVTGSKYLLAAAGRRVMVDCGLFQGLKQLRLKNWAPFPLRAGTIEAVALTHAHLDHSGYLPRFVKKGFAGAVHSSPGTLELCAILLPDSGYLQEEEARHANKHSFSKHKPALPLYIEDEARACLKRFSALEHGAEREIASGCGCSPRAISSAPRSRRSSTGEREWCSRAILAAAADELRRRIEETLGWTVHVPEHGEQAKLA